MGRRGSGFEFANSLSRLKASYAQLYQEKE